MSLKSRNLEKRNGVWYVRVMYKGKRIRRSTGHIDRVLAWEAAKRIYADLVEGNHEALDRNKIRTGYSSIGEVISVFRAGAIAFALAPRTVGKYISSLRLIIRTVHPHADTNDMSTEILTRDLLLAYRDEMLETIGAGEERQDIRTRRSIASIVNQARAIFGARWAMASYHDAGLRLPDLSGFRFGRICKSDPVYYVRPDEDLIKRTMEAGAGLAETDEGLWAAYVLCYWLGLRSGEAAEARHSWIRKEESIDGPRWYIYVIARHDDDGAWSPKGSEGKVPVPVRVVEWIERLRRPDDDYILPGGSATARENLVARRLAEWMRDLGWDQKRYKGAAHELRKLRGSEWYTERGIEAACAWLRHGDISTTKRFYAAFTSHPPALEVVE